jgi:hypothetical protein
MLRLLRISAFALPLVAGGAVFAQGSGTSGSAGAPGTATDQAAAPTDTRTPEQEKAGTIDDQAPAAVPGDATQPYENHDKAVRKMRTPGHEDMAPYGTMKANPSQTGVQPTTSPKQDEQMRQQEQQQLHEHQLDSDK